MLSSCFGRCLNLVIDMDTCVRTSRFSKSSLFLPLSVILMRSRSLMSLSLTHVGTSSPVNISRLWRNKALLILFLFWCKKKHVAVRFIHLRISNRLTHLDPYLQVFFLRSHRIGTSLTWRVLSSNLLLDLINVFDSSLLALLLLAANLLELLWIFILVFLSNSMTASLILNSNRWGKFNFIGDIASSATLASRLTLRTRLFLETNLVVWSVFLDFLKIFFRHGVSILLDVLIVSILFVLRSIWLYLGNWVLSLESVFPGVVWDNLRCESLMSLKASLLELLDLLMLIEPLVLHLCLEIFTDLKVFNFLKENFLN